MTSPLASARCGIRPHHHLDTWPDAFGHVHIAIRGKTQVVELNLTHSGAEYTFVVDHEFRSGITFGWGLVDLVRGNTTPFLGLEWVYLRDPTHAGIVRISADPQTCWKIGVVICTRIILDVGCCQQRRTARTCPTWRRKSVVLCVVRSYEMPSEYTSPPLYRVYVSVTSWHSTLAPKARITPTNMVGLHEKCGLQREEGATFFREPLNWRRLQVTCQSSEVRSVTADAHHWSHFSSIPGTWKEKYYSGSDVGLHMLTIDFTSAMSAAKTFCRRAEFTRLRTCRASTLWGTLVRPGPSCFPSGIHIRCERAEGKQDKFSTPHQTLTLAKPLSWATSVEGASNLRLQVPRCVQ